MKAQPADKPLRWGDADGFFDLLLDAHQGLSPEESANLNARLVLVLAHEVGDAQALARCLVMAQEAMPDSPKPSAAET
jgi:hypothetical protein